MANVKSVSFSKLLTFYYYTTVDLEKQLDYMQLARDRIRFKNRINRLKSILEPVLMGKIEKTTYHEC